MSEKVEVWCDISSITKTVCIEIEGRVAEDAAGLSEKNDFNHINVAKLDVVIKGVNMALKLGLKDREVHRDSVTDLRWIDAMIKRVLGQKVPQI